MLGLPLHAFSQLQQVALDLPNSRACETEGIFLVSVGLVFSCGCFYRLVC